MNTSTHQYESECSYLGPEYDSCTHRGPSPYCGCRTNGFSSYCEQHYPIVYNVGSAARKRHKEQRQAAQVWDMESMFNEVVLELESE